MDIQLHFIRAGEGEPLVLLHGNGEDSSYFAHQIAYFSKRYQVLAVDTRGHGKSPRGNAPFTIRQFVQDLAGFLEEQRTGPVDLLGLMVHDPMIPVEDLKKVAAPTLVIAGTRDMIREEHTRKIAEAIPNAKLVLLPGDHFIANRSPEAFNSAVGSFLTGPIS